MGVPVVYYVTPQVWAWRAGRMKTMQTHVALALPIFPFEEPLYQTGRRPGAASSAIRWSTPCRRRPPIAPRPRVPG